MTEDIGGRIFFSNTGRTFGEEDELCVLSVGVDIGSSTSHLVFSRIVLERLDARYVVTERESFYQSDILLTPYASEDEIDAVALGAFIERQYKDGKIDPDEIDTGALILTGVAVRRSNAQRIGELFARQAGRLVAVSAGDSLEAVMAAYGSGAVARSIRNRAPVMNVDVGGGTAKIAICAEGKVTDVTAVDIGARLIVLDNDRRIIRLEEAGRSFGAELGLELKPGTILSENDATAIATRMADCLFDAMRGKTPRAGGAALLRLDPVQANDAISDVSFSGGVSEYLYGGEAKAYGDLGPQLAAQLRTRLHDFGAELARPDARIRATVIGASQYTMQVSGSTIFVSPLTMLPLRNIPVIAPALPLDGDVIDAGALANAIKGALKRLDLGGGESPVAVFVSWRGSATFRRLDDFCKGVADGLRAVLAHGHPIVLVGDGDVGGLIGIHYREEMKIGNPIVSIDGLELKEFDYIDIGTILDTSGAVPVVIKSLVFPGSSGLGRDWQAKRAVSSDRPAKAAAKSQP
ncbi:MAG TPA: ethanolamine ammonia-lyase reactivating factor EutA [Xanthobacteraceae bacterium]|jgi:ethanolamine utilization protein EutA|nr:ethanolamine ammonia-lyase reactivating factor EutA [Xanthobacteraceae bacterium]